MNKPTDSVRIVVFNQDGKFLVLTEADDVDNWKLPGGRFDSEGETPDEAAERELAEELGLRGEDVSLTPKQELVNDDGESKRYIYAAICDAGSVQPTDEVAKTEWVDENSIPEGKNSGHIRSAWEAASSE